MQNNDEFGFDYSGLQAYSGYYIDDVKLKKSASGGGATALAEAVIKNGGVVFGVVYTSDFKGAEYCCAETVEQLEKIQGSKYIEPSKKIFYKGKYENIYSVVEMKLKAGVEVLFTGLGCTVAALYSFLENRNVDCSNLYTVDLICHGPTSPEVAKQYIENLEKRYKSNIVEFSVRYKKKGWVPPYIYAKFENNKIYEVPFYESDYGYALNLFSRPFCYECRFRGENHKADLTVGDYWGITSKMEGYNSNGVSIFIVKTKQGERLLGKIDKTIFNIRHADVKHALQHNHMYYEKRKKHANWEKFEKDLKERGLHYATVNSTGKVKYFIRRNPLTIFVARNLPQSVKKRLLRYLVKIKISLG